MRLRKCSFPDCVWKEKTQKKYRGSRNAIFKVYVSPKSPSYSCEGCVRWIIEQHFSVNIRIKPFIKRAEKILVLLKLEWKCRIKPSSRFFFCIFSVIKKVFTHFGRIYHKESKARKLVYVLIHYSFS